MAEDLTTKAENLEKGKEQNNEDKNVVNETQETLAKLKAANDAVETELLRKEELRAKAINAGRANAGQIVQEKSKEDIAKEEAEKIIKMFRS